MAMTKIKGLQMWCRKMTDGYSNVSVDNFTTAWRNGLAFCAIIHRFRPDLIDFDSLSSENVLYNNKLAFEIAEKELGIPAFLEADDMARLKVPDKLSVITYVSQYYNFLNALPQLGGPGVKGNGPKKTSSISGVKRAPDDDISQAPSTKKTVKSPSPTAEGLKQQKSSPPRQNTVGDKCAICQNKVYLLERHIEEGKLYHRSCFRHSELSPTNRVFTRSPFMSPSLNSEKVTQENHTEKRPERSTPLPTLSPRQGDNVKGPKDTPLTKDTAKSNLSSVLKRVEAAGMKHSLGTSEREEDSKKSKFQPSSLFEGKSSTAVNKHSREDMGKRTDQKDKDNVSGLPLSSKEARKLEKRRQEIIDSEKAPQANVGAKRAMPLIFQQKDSQATTSAPNSSSSTSVSTSSTAALAKPSTLASSSSRPGLSSSKFCPTTNERRQRNADSTKSGVSEQENASQNVLRKQSAPSITSLQQKFSAGGDDAKSPVAKPRLSAVKEVPSKPYNRETAGTKSNSSVTLREKENCPKPAPRKSLVEPTSKKMPPERPKYSPHAKVSSSAESSSSADERSTPRSSSSTSPPPLPTSPPPSLTSSQPPSSATVMPHHPPPLPTSSPPPLPSKTPSSSKVPTSKSSSSIPASTLHSSVTSSPSQVPKTTALGRPSKTPTTKDVSLSHKSPQTHQFSSSSAVSKEPPVAVLATPTTTKDDSTVLSGLLTSLAGIRGRSASTPNAVEVSTTTTSSVSTTISHSSVSSSIPSSTHTTSSSRKYSESFVTSSFKPNVSTGATSNTAKESNASSVARINLKPTVSTCTPSQLTNSTKTTTSKSIHPEKITEALSVLSSLKPVSSSDASKTSKPQSSSPSATSIEDKMKTRSHSDPKALSNGGPKTLSDVKLKTKTEDAHKSNSSSKTKENSTFLKDVHLKRVMPEPKTDAGDPTNNAALFNIALKKVELSASNVEPKKSVEIFQVPGDIKTVGESNQAKDSKPAVSKNQMRDRDDSIPQWRKDIEERKKRLRDDIARAEAKSPSYTKHTKERPKSADVLSLIENSKEARKDSLSSVSESPCSDSSSSSISSSSSLKKKSKSIADISSDINGKLDWQLEAERKIAAFALFDSSEDESRSSSRKSDNEGRRTVARQNKPDDSHRATEHTTSTKNTFFSEPRKPELKATSKPPNQLKQNARKNNLTEAQSQLKESGGFRSKIEFRAVDINISCEGGMDQGDKNTVIQYSKDESQGKVTLTEPLSINNSNNRNNASETPEIKRPPQGDNDKTQASSATSDNESLKENDTGKGKHIEKDKQERNKDKEQDTTTSPNLKRKITFLGRLDNDAKSPPPLRKITVDREFDFDSNSVASSEFESSLTQSTSKLSLNDEHTPVSSHPPQRPPRPKSQRNKTPSPRQISAIELQQQLLEIDSRLTDLELRGRDLEDSIRNDFVDGTDSKRHYNDLDDETVNTVEEDDEELMIQWFSLVREKNDLVREEADLVYLSREQDLEDEQHQIDVQLRYLMTKEENVKSPQEKEEEDYLLQRKLDIVNQRSSIVDSMDEDRLRYEEEDRNIEDVLLEKGLIRNASGTLMAKKGLKVAKSKFYA